jgi:uracil-DNA glycosylase
MTKRPLSPEMRDAVAVRLAYYRELGIHDFYRRPVPESVAQEADGEAAGLKAQFEEALREGTLAPTEEEVIAMAGHAEDHAAALRAIREDLGDCTRCPLHKQGRKQIVFGTGNPYADLMFVGEAPGADEDIQGEPFVGRAGQLLNNMIAAMGLRREDVYIANVIKCRPPGNRTPEPGECAICSPFLLRQIEAIQPKALVALGAVAAKTLLAVNQPMNSLRGRWYEFHGFPLLVTFHPAYLLRNPPAKKDAWQDLQMVMKRLGLKAPQKNE